MKAAILCALLLTGVFAPGMGLAQDAAVALTFAPSVIEVGTPSVINLLIDCSVASCAALDLSVRFDPTALRIDDIALGDFPVQGGREVYLLAHQVNPDGASFTLRYLTAAGAAPASTGQGVLASITVTGLAEGTSELQFLQAAVAPLAGAPVYTAATLDAAVVVLPAAARRTLSVRVEAGAAAQVSVTGPDSVVLAERLVDQTLLLEISPTADAATVLELAAPGHLACAAPVAPARTITLPAGDVNNDGVIDLQDALLVRAAISSDQPASADVNGDGAVNLFDLILVGRNFGQRSGAC